MRRVLFEGRRASRFLYALVKWGQEICIVKLTTKFTCL